jgi:hypothetical protein
MGFLTVLGNPVVRYALLSLAVVSFLGYVRKDAADQARLIERAACQQEVQEATMAERDRQRQAGAQALADATRRAAEAETAAAELQRTADELLAQIEGQGLSCPIPADVLRRLRDIR